jgi:hypothetical protein
MKREDIHTLLLFHFLDYRVPKWANWVGIDPTGEVCVFEVKPVIMNAQWMNHNHRGAKWDFIRGLNSNSNLNEIDDDGFLNFFGFLAEEPVDFWKELLFEL